MESAFSCFAAMRSYLDQRGKPEALFGVEAKPNQWIDSFVFSEAGDFTPADGTVRVAKSQGKN